VEESIKRSSGGAPSMLRKLMGNIGAKQAQDDAAVRPRRRDGGWRFGGRGCHARRTTGRDRMVAPRPAAEAQH
ncbi:hypothetical protein AB0L74_30730, partial [Streptomyces sp. NPDC052020]|uniref:hypothetical protein n=1 Tax=Streptomyces sp. NPDC052020 TaxID=3155677 RepID=UPI00341F6A27